MSSTVTQSLTVSQLNQYLQGLMDQDMFLRNVYVRGELSNYKIYPSGHHYFTMKDEACALKCVMFKSYAQRIQFSPRSGMQVVAMGRVSVYPRDGQYQLYCTGMVADGIGDLYVAFEQLKEKLNAEGLFQLAKKKPLPAFPHRVAIVTSGAGAAVHDMIRILGKRYPLARVRIFPVRVQGSEAPDEIVGALRYINHYQLADVILCGRGGGSIEDLWAFNDERVARAIFASIIPVVSAVGHEPDVTIADFVADVRASTPSNGAELVAPDQDELRQRLDQTQMRMYEALIQRIKLYRRQLEALCQNAAIQNPEHFIRVRRGQLEQQHRLLYHGITRTLEYHKRRVVKMAAALDAMSPLKVLSRGYGLLLHDQQVVSSVKQIHPGDTLTVCVADGKLDATVRALWEESTWNNSHNL